ncbi:hypothetical protein Peur_070855 [Populus x canadensis]
MGLSISSCGDDTLQFRRCLAASFFFNAALKQPEGTHRYYISLYKLRHPFAFAFRILSFFYYSPLLTSIWRVRHGIHLLLKSLFMLCLAFHSPTARPSNLLK